MLIGINKNKEIKQVGLITDKTLHQLDIIIDKFHMFYGWSDQMILCYCYDNGSISPQSNEKFAEWQNLKLQHDNELLRSQIGATQEAVNYLLMGGNA